VELILEHQAIADNFFGGLLRFWHQNVKNEDTWKKLRLVIVHPKNISITVEPPLNVGTVIEFP
jgi:serine/threonine-protein kinase